MPKGFKLITCIVVCELAGIIGSIFTINSIPTWYATLQKPIFSPPNYLFGPVWTTLYFLMGISFYLIVSKKLKGKNKKAIYIFAVQLFLNAIWSPIFFSLKSPLWGLIVIITLWFAIILTIKEFWKIEKRAAYLLLPYLAWVSFATVLNLSIYILNK